ncbi:MAG: UDP-N-acetylmuramoyl-L-alanine--D-glutamate ligase [Actinobacteria bacterium]|nr:UDP-N-acetylmuramoyl-L-alanine--D-glutamate ligase [Actinomycetota bacterium]
MGEHPLPEVSRALVIGLGRSGRPAAEALAAADVEVIGVDVREDIDRTEDLRGLGVDVRAGVDDEATARIVAQVDLVVPSPGVPENSEALRRAAELGVPVWSEPELGWRLARRGSGRDPDVIGITGTNGKTTTTELTADMLTTAGLEAVGCGNLGHPFTAAALEAGSDTVLVAELSSFQLRFAHSLRPRIGMLLNLAPDHLDWHPDVEAYAAAKARLWQAQEAGDWAVANADDERVEAVVTAHAPGRTAWFSTRHIPEVGVGFRDDRLVAALPDVHGPLLETGSLPLRAPHHLANVAGAACCALLAGATAEAVARSARSFRPGRHRMEVVADGDITWIDDSKATNPHAAAAALRAHRDRPTVWIAGGLAKGVDLEPLAEELTGVHHAVLIGEAAETLAGIASAAGVDVTLAGSIEEAVTVARRVARSGDVVLLAPACASFDQFRDYVERGQRFAAAVRAETT